MVVHTIDIEYPLDCSDDNASRSVCEVDATTHDVIHIDVEHNDLKLSKAGRGYLIR